MVVEKKVVSFDYFCDVCGKQIEGKVYSPVWGELDTDGDGNYDRGGDIISVDICEKCRKDAEQMIVGLFSRYKEAAHGTDDGSQAKVNKGNRDGYESKPKDELARELAQELAQPPETEEKEAVKKDVQEDSGEDEAEEKSDIRSIAEEIAGMDQPRKRRGGKKVNIDKGKIMGLHHSGMSTYEIAKLLGCSQSYVSRKIREKE